VRHAAVPLLPSQAQQLDAMGNQKLTGLFGLNPCPNMAKP
jgi:hypothetical protein